jgi:hypothetical protein
MVWGWQPETAMTRIRTVFVALGLAVIGPCAPAWGAGPPVTSPMTASSICATSSR